ncbi:MAG: 1-deoxy-D-xylulose-5-phosphate reductoisomerase [Candidatus Neomarinimicrobiota bacterium]|nr:1-deoxy-D-xylulose-5-phosphate reductoisomerase [Candidatus Neomarinimicrobiota bacterium]
MKKKISILGSTGSIGVNALNVIRNISKNFKIRHLTGNTNSELMIEQSREFNPDSIVMINEAAAEKVKKELVNDGVEVLSGRNNLLKIAKNKSVDLVLNALVGSHGMEPTLNALKAGVDVALSNKESLVVAGDIITAAMNISGAKLFPVDSEHSAIWQCMLGESLDDIERIILTGSGGPFRERPLKTFDNILVSEALNHPNWDMGKKITIDSATMMNKGLEVIEAYWLFNMQVSQIDIIVHPQSIIHSMIEFKDGSIKAQMGVPDMKVPIQYALTYPTHLEAPWERLDFTMLGDLSFQAPDFDRFPCIKLAYLALDKMGTTPAVLNMANDYCVYKFLDEKIKFTDIPVIIESAMNNHEWTENPNLDYLKELDLWTENFVNNFNSLEHIT